MATLEQAANLLRGARMEVEKCPDDRFALVRAGSRYYIDGSDIDRYLAIKDGITSIVETQIFFPGFYEHVVQFEGARPRRPFMFREGEDNQLRLKSRDGVAVEVSRPSPLFALAFFDTDQLTRDQTRLAFSMGLRSSQEASISDLFRLYTIRVLADPESALGKSAKRLHDIAEASVFHFAFGKGTPISFTKTWARTYYWIGRRGNEEVQFPLKTYNSELVGYYNLALSSDSMVLAFLALYKILEFFFSAVTEEELHRRLRERLTAPDFSHTKAKKLREVVKTVQQFDNRSDELSALRMVISKYFDMIELKSWVDAYEAENGAYFTSDVEIFSKTHRIDTSASTIVPNIASRIYSIRNAIVHNKEAEVSRYVPYSGQEETLHKEIKLLVHLAEQLIVRSGKDIVS